MSARALAWVVAVLLAACGERAGRECLERVGTAPDGTWTREVTSEGDRTRVVLKDGTAVVLPAQAKRIVSTLPSITELVAYLAGADALVGVSPWCNWPPEVRALPKVSVLPIDVETLKGLAPDLVLCDGTFHAASLQLLRRHFPDALPVESRSLAHLAATVEVLGRVLGGPHAEERAAALLQDLDRAVAEARSAAKTPPLRVLLVGQPDPLHVLGPGSLLDDLLRACGCVDVACDLGRASGPFSVEVAIARRPDWILTTGDPLTADLLKRWAGMPAVRAGRLASANVDDLLRAGPRTPGALRRLAAVLKGDLPPERLAATP
jgi:ABC-type Fe3+-hydroxamate transport system substrate-binding protein